MPWQRKADAPFVVVLDAGRWGILLTRWPWLQYLAPALAGEVLDVTSFCAAGPMVPPVTMDDIVWFGFPPDDGRPHTILTVTRAIGRGEAFALYCENPSNAGTTWRTYVDNLCVNRTGEVWDSVMWAGATAIPAAAESMRVTLYSGVSNKLQWGVSHTPLVVAESLESATNNAIYHTGTGSSTTNVGSTVTQGIQQFVIDHPPCYPFLVSGGGYEPATTQFCCKIEFLAPGSGDFTPVDPVQDPNVTLPDGTGATLDQLEVKLDFIQQALRQQVTPDFALDLASMLGPAENVAGDLVDAVGLLVNIIDRPPTVSEWWGVPARYPHMAYITFGNTEGWWDANEIDIESSVYLPLPTGASRFSIVCKPPMRATATFYRPTMGPQ